MTEPRSIRIGDRMKLSTPLIRLMQEDEQRDRIITTTVHDIIEESDGTKILLLRRDD